MCSLNVTTLHKNRDLRLRSHLSWAIAVLLLGQCLWNHANAQQSPGGRAKKESALSLTKKEVARAEARISQLESEISSLHGRIRELESSHAELGQTVKGTEKKLDETGWKALDFSGQLVEIQWAIIGAILAFGGVVFGLLGIGIYGWLAHKIENKFTDLGRKQEEASEAARHRNYATAVGQISYAFWQQYSEAEPADANERQRNLRAAIRLSSFALRHAERLNALIEATVNEADKASKTERYEETITGAIANHAYWLAEQCRPEDRQIALRLGWRAHTLASDHMGRKNSKAPWYDWAECYCWVLWKYGDEDQKRWALARIAEICADPRVDMTWKPVVRGKYGLTN